MAKTHSDLSDLDERISEISQQVKERFSTLKQQVSAQQLEMEKLSEQYSRLTGKTLLQGNGSMAAAKGGLKPGPKVGAKAGGKGKTKAKGKRTRLPSPTKEWLLETLGKKNMTVKQLQEAANSDNLSGLKIAVMLKENKSKLKSEVGTKPDNVKGKPPMVYGLK